MRTATQRATAAIEFVPRLENSFIGPARDKKGHIRRGFWKIRIGRGDTGHPNEIRCSLAHELGHLLALTFAFPAAMADPRLIKGANRGTKADKRERILDAEIEAWQLACRILPQIPLEVMENAMESYGVKKSLYYYRRN